MSAPDSYIADWKNGEFSIETETPGDGSAVTAEGPFTHAECREKLNERGMVENTEFSCFFRKNEGRDS